MQATRSRSIAKKDRLPSRRHEKRTVQCDVVSPSVLLVCVELLPESSDPFDVGIQGIHDKKTTNGVKAFAYFDLDENNNVKNYTLVTSDAVYYSPDGGKTWTQK